MAARGRPPHLNATKKIMVHVTPSMKEQLDAMIEARNAAGEQVSISGFIRELAQGELNRWQANQKDE